MEVDEFKYSGVYPMTLFMCFDMSHGMHFILLLKHTPSDELEELMEKLHFCGANVSFDLRDMTDYSAIITDHEDDVDFEGPVFTLNYIKDCLELRELQDIADYRTATSNQIVLTSNSFMMVVYYRVRHWGSMIRRQCNNEQPMRSNSDNDDLLVCSSSTDSLRKSKPSETIQTEQEPDSTTDDTKMKSKQSNKERNTEEADSTTVYEYVRKNSRRPYSYEEECNILKYIINHSEYSSTKGMKMWTVMERRKVCPDRTWQSMKEHYLKKILTNINSFTFLSDREKNKLILGNRSEVHTLYDS